MVVTTGPSGLARSRSLSKSRSQAAAVMGRSTVPRPTATRKKRLHRAAPRPTATAWTAGRSASVSSQTSVFTWNGMPAATHARAAATVRSKHPGTPRRASCRVASEPSRLSETASTPAGASRSIICSVNSGVALGATDTPKPRARAAAISSKRSGRLSGSPPVKTRCGSGAPKRASRSMRARPSGAVSSAGSGSGAASARQWRQARSHARVSSQ